MPMNEYYWKCFWVTSAGNIIAAWLAVIEHAAHRRIVGQSCVNVLHNLISYVCAYRSEIKRLRDLTGIFKFRASV